MSSTGRSKGNMAYRESIKDYYATPISKIHEFLNAFKEHEPGAFDGVVLDPCAGGDEHHPMSYPTALMEFGVPKEMIRTIDIREDSRADVIGDYLNIKLDYRPKVIITNPPFEGSIAIIEKALDDVEDDGLVIMLQRLNFMGGKNKKYFWDKQLPKYIFVHHRRISFTDDGKTDSIEYSHYVFQKGYYPKFSLTCVI